MNGRFETLRDGQRVVIRQLLPDDDALYPEFLAGVTADDLRLRFFAPTAEVGAGLVEKLTHYDPKRAMAFIALSEDEKTMLGVVRLHDDPTGDGAEFAVLVRSSLKGHGLGWLLIRRMIEYARQKGLGAVHGQVLPENSTMLTMCKELGFHVADDPSERGIKRVTLSIANPRNQT